MRHTALVAIRFTLLTTLLLGLGYPLAVTAIAQLAFPRQANGSLVLRGGRAIGSSLLAQRFDGEGYFHPRPSAAGEGYDATSSGGANLAESSEKLVSRVQHAADPLRAASPDMPVPVDLVTASGSGLDPDISPAAADFEVARISRARGIDPSRLRELVRQHTQGRQFGLLGERRVNVLELNLALDALARRQAD
jgi:K+-transporting ATPase ATPase C chain